MSSGRDVGGASGVSVSGWLTLALIVSQAVYALVAWLVLAGGLEPLAGAAAPVVGPVLLVAALAALGLASVLPGRLRSSRSGDGDEAGARLGAHLLAQALRESVGVLGLVATLLTGELVWVLLLGAVATIALLMGWLREMPG